MIAARTFFLVLGVGRGGTTLLANCIDSHPQARCYNEIGDDLLRGKDHPAYRVLRRLAHVPGVSRVAARVESLTDRRLAQAGDGHEDINAVGLRRMEAFHESIHATLAAQPERAVGDKIVIESLAMVYRRPYEPQESPADDAHAAARHAGLEHFACRLFAAYRFIFIVRDGRASLTSKMKRGHQSLLEAAAHWLEAARVHRTLADMLGPRLLTVRFEGLVADPGVVLSQVGDFLGIGYDPQMLAGANRKYGDEERHGFEHDRLRADPAAPYNDLIREGLEYFGYPIESRRHDA
jgi:hypothetical protein